MMHGLVQRWEGEQGQKQRTWCPPCRVSPRKPQKVSPCTWLPFLMPL